MAEGDEVEESLSQAMRVSVTSAIRVGQALAQVRQRQAERRRTDSERRTRELQRTAAVRQAQVAEQQATATAERERTARETARGSYRRAQNPGWWDTATPSEVGAAYGAAAAWRDVDPEAAGTAASMSQTLRERYDVDPDRLPVDHVGPRLEAAIGDASERQTLDLAEAHGLLAAAEAADSRGHDDREDASYHDDAREEVLDEARTAPSPGESESAAQLVDHEQSARDEHLVDADQEHALSTEDTRAAESVYDTAARRQDTAAELRSTVDHPHAEDAIAAKMAADASQAKPIREAVQKVPSRGPSKAAGIPKKVGQQQHRSLHR